MTSRVRILLLVLAVLLVGGLGFAAWALGVKPYLDRAKAVAAADREASQKETEAVELLGRVKKLKALQLRSLPAGVQDPRDPERSRKEYADVAKREYEEALRAILLESGARNSQVQYVEGDSTNLTGIPKLEPKANPPKGAAPYTYLAYTPVVFQVKIPKTDLGTAAEVLRRYYALGLLQQITHLSVKEVGPPDVVADPRQPKDRTDLEVLFVTKALIVNGAPTRKSLLPVTPGHGAAIGGAGQFAAGLTEPALAHPTGSFDPSRDYSLLAAKDLFHGPLPGPVEPPGSITGFVYEETADDTRGPAGVSDVGVALFRVEKGKETQLQTTATNSKGEYKFLDVKPGPGYVVRIAQPSDFSPGKSTPGSTGGKSVSGDELADIVVLRETESKNNNFGLQPPPPVKKPDFSEFITYTFYAHKQEGDYHTFDVFIKDKINNEEYEVTITQAGEVVRVKATKWYYNTFKIDPAERRKREYMNEPMLDISKPASMSTKRKFTVYGVEADGSLILGERPAVTLPELPKDDPKKGGKKGVMPAPDLKAAVLGGTVVLAPKPEVVYRWEHRKTLKEIVPLSKAEGEKAVKRVKTWLQTESIDPNPPEPKPETKDDKPKEEKPPEPKPDDKKDDKPKDAKPEEKEEKKEGK